MSNIKSTFVEEKPIPIIPTYPYIGKHTSSNVIVMFDKPECGMVMGGSENRKLGEYRIDWLEDGFVQIHGELTLKF